MATFELADGSKYPGYIRAVPDNWDTPLPPRKMRDGNYTKPLQWSARRGGSPLSILSLHCPVMFVDGRGLDFHLKREPRRKAHVRNFYETVGKPPNAVFPVRFHADPVLASRIVEGRMDGFYTFPLDKPFEIDTGAALLGGDKEANQPELKQSADLSADDFERHAVWVRVHEYDMNEPWYGRADKFTFRPWTGPLPVAAGMAYVRVRAKFTLRDGSAYRGYMRPVREDWADVIPPPSKSKTGMVFQRHSLRIARGGSPFAIIGEHLPTIFVEGQRFGFWGGATGVSVEKRQAFYHALGKAPDSIFPVRFQAESGFATGILAGEVDGFYRVMLGPFPPKVGR